MLMSSIGQSGSKKNMTSFPFLPTFTVNGLGHEQEIVDEYVGRGVNSIYLRTLASETLPECQTCPFGSYCGYCVARGVNQHGSPIPNIPFDSECQMYKEMIPYLFRSALVTGALLTSTLLGLMLASPASAGEHCDRWHWNHCHSNSPMYTDGYGCHDHYHENWDGPCYT